MTTPAFTPLIYSELTVGRPDFISLAERCELLTQILLDCQPGEDTAAVCRCLAAWLDALSVALDNSMSDFRVVQLTAATLSGSAGEWLSDDSALQCDYCRALNQALLLLPANEQAHRPLRGLLHDVVGYMTEELKAPRFCQA
ncbi:hypothetical protein ACSFCW_02725 [Yokenella regensburgei]|jgi:hypothetical protein|uniref:hypothetical protein n=1 Tax=Yokenella regensburgei TaxID=158877 RepID=UPI0027D94E73|nr:hypothetical protein [Yokenella regensburgei]MDQ4431555.1 hypothetical protein [Yokenella regensburgei]